MNQIRILRRFSNEYLNILSPTLPPLSIPRAFLSLKSVVDFSSDTNKYFNEEILRVARKTKKIRIVIILFKDVSHEWRFESKSAHFYMIVKQDSSQMKIARAVYAKLATGSLQHLLWFVINAAYRILPFCKRCSKSMWYLNLQYPKVWLTNHCSIYVPNGLW